LPSNADPERGKQMERRVTADLIEGAYDICVQELTRLTSEQESGDENRLKLDVIGIIPILAWQVVVPFLISLTAGLAGYKLSSKQIKKKSVAELKNSAIDTIGKIISLENPDDREESVILIEELLQPFRITRQQAREIVRLLTDKIEQPEK
jgi:hypothetical protein